MGLHYHSVCSASATLNSARLEPPRPLPLAPRCIEKASSTRGGGRGLCLVFSSCRYGSSIYSSGSPAVPPPHTHPANIYWMNASGVSPPPSPQPLPQGFLPSHLITPKPRERALARNIKEKNQNKPTGSAYIQHRMEATSHYLWRPFQPLKGWGFAVSEFQEKMGLVFMWGDCFGKPLIESCWYPPSWGQR